MRDYKDHSHEIDPPIIVTSFRDFELEERVVRILAARGFPIGQRKITGEYELKSQEILITDSLLGEPELPVITLPQDAREWSDFRVQSFLQDQFISPLPAERNWPSLLLIGGEEFIELREELIAALIAQGHRSLLTTFDERDLRSALIPTRRYEERERFARFAHASVALLLLTPERSEIGKAHSLIEYHRRVHPHLQLAFIIYGGRKAERSEITSILEPFPVFYLHRESDQLFSLPEIRRGKRKFVAIMEWIGSRHGDSSESSDLEDGALTRRDRPSRRTRRSVAITR